MGDLSAQAPRLDDAGRGPMPWGSLSRAGIVAAAKEIARREGMSALTIRRLAADLGASRMAIYRHVTDKDHLVDLVRDAVAEYEVLPADVASGPWHDRLRRIARGMHAELSAYPGLIEVLLSRRTHGPGSLRLADTILGILQDAGLEGDAAVPYYLVFIDLVVGRTQRELHGDPVGTARMAGLAAAAREADGVPRLRAAADALAAADAAAVLDTELSMLVAAVSAAADGPSGSGPSS
jgi:AcrR family transcriptional regulator